jgi:hypothetical protein
MLPKHPQITQPTHAHTHTLQNKLNQAQYKIYPNVHGTIIPMLAGMCLVQGSCQRGSRILELREYDMIYLLTAIGCHPVEVHIYTQTIHRTTQITTEQHK